MDDVKCPCCADISGDLVLPFRARIATRCVLGDGSLRHTHNEGVVHLLKCFVMEGPDPSTVGSASTSVWRQREYIFGNREGGGAGCIVLC